jgi:hypothetical protein
MATPAQLQAQAALLEQQIARLTQQISAADIPPQQQQALIIQRGQSLNDLVVVQQEITSFTQQSNPPDPTVPVAAPVDAAPTLFQPPAVPGSAAAGPAFSQGQTAISAPGEVAVANTNASVLNAIGVSQPTPVEAGPSSGYYTASTAEQNKANELNFGRDAAFEAAQVEQLKREAAVQAEFQSPASGDWRVRLRLAPGATYLYKDTDAATSILAPLAASNGVVFPYMPTISTSYNANYDQTDLTHSNYRGQFYKSSYVGDIQISGEFTAQDTAEANYLLAVIHFFRSVTKMFYGAKDSFRGTPPPLVYLIGLGQYQFNNQPCVVRTFNYSMPNNCDYIRTKPNNYNVNLGDRQTKTATGGSNPFTAVLDRLRNSALSKGALPNVPSQTLLDLQSVNNIDNSTYVPTRCEISITLMPIQTRNQQSTLFNMKEYASGQLLKGGFW